ncbi:HAD family hydrolase [Robertkochia solimangrovi]|uniref:HAD family hydrolase n=1 Tax=Robertkochia solimangrovi TaxID=2213046 RepID=UPI00117C0877|nr:HAD family hydrolase [Robertkochia solimangrovi]TRZ41780.1 Cof-type HAD-IIB family hydrolase [Robertkochia solimangrovi]
MNPKIFFTDIDGTLLNKDRELSEYTISRIDAISENHPFIMVSARMPDQMKHFREKLQKPESSLIAYNGALVLRENQVIHSVEIDSDTLQRIHEYNLTLPERFHISLYNHDEWYVEKMDYWAKREENNTKVTPRLKPNEKVISEWKLAGKGAHKILCMGDAEIIEKAFQDLTEMFGDSLHLYRAKDTYIEIANREVSKLTGIKKLLELMEGNPTLEDVVAFGDNYNDVEMIAGVGCGVAVANARDEVKAVARDITLHHKEDGVAKYLDRFIL